MAGVSQSEISRIEAGLATYASIELWMRVALILERRPRFEVSNDPRQEPTDAGHLGIQELVLRLARQTGRHGIFELPTRSAEAWRSTDVGIRDERHRALILVECWNMIGDIGAAARSTSRKLVEAEQLAVASGGDHSYPGRGLLGCEGDEAQSRPRRSIPGGVRREISWLVNRLGPGARERRAATNRAGAGLGRPERDAHHSLAEARHAVTTPEVTTYAVTTYAVMTEPMISSRRSRTIGSATPAASISPSASSRYRWACARV